MAFTATDGTTFETRDEWRKYEFETNYTFKNKTKESLMKVPGNIDGQPFDLADLTDCEVVLLDHSDQIQVDHLVNCRVFIGPCCESVFVRNCQNCIFTIACKQLRTRDCVQCDMYLYSKTDPIIETSSQMRFAPFNGAYNGLRQHFAKANLDPENNHWSRIYDFNDPDKSGANWSIMTPDQEMAPWVMSLEAMIPGIEQSLGAPENPVARDAQATIYDDNGGTSTMQAFSFDTSQDQAQGQMDELPSPAVAQQPPPVSLAPLSSDPFGLPPAPASSEPPSVVSSDDPFGIPDPMMMPPSQTGSDSGLQPHHVLDPIAPPPVSSVSVPATPPVSMATGIVPPTSSGAKGPESWPKMEAFEQEWASRLSEKKAAEEKLVAKVKKEAEESLDRYYDERTDKLAHRAATNREHEAEKIKTQSILKETAAEQPWTRVVDLVDTTTKVKKMSDRSAAEIVDINDTAKMKSLLVQLKNSDGLEIHKA